MLIKEIIKLLDKGMPLIFDTFLRVFRALGKTPQILLIDRIGLYLQQNGRDVTLAPGYCHGLALYWAYMKKNGQEQQYFDLITKLALWNGVDDYDTDFEKLLAHIEWLQRKHELLHGRGQLDFESTIDFVKEKESSQTFVESYEFTFSFKEGELVDTLEQLCKEGEIILFASHGHRVAMIYEDDKYHFFDANSFRGLGVYNSIEEFINDKNGLVQSLIFPETTDYWEGMKSEIRKKVLGLSVPENFPLNISILRTKNDPIQQYPAQSDLMKAILAKRSEKNVNVDINGRGYKQQTSLIYAASSNDFESVKALVNLGADINAQDKNGRTSLHYAAITNNIEMVRYLLSKNADPSLADTDGRTPLHFYHDYKRDVELKSELIKKGADILVKDKFDKRPLHTFVDEYPKDDVVFLLATALQQAILKNDSKKIFDLFNLSKDEFHVPMMKKLFELGIPQDKKKSWYVFVLENNQSGMINSFINNKAPITYNDLLDIKKFNFPEKDKLVNTIEVRLLHEAIERNDASLAAQLLSENLNLIQSTYKNHDPMQTALNAKQSEMVEFLINNGAEYKEIGREKQNPVAYALEKEDLASVKILMQHGIDFENIEGVAVLTDQPSHISHADLTEFLNSFVDKPVKANIEVLMLRSSLVTATKRGFLDVVQRILKASPELIDQVEKDNNTLLHVAAQQDNVEMMKFLLERSKVHHLHTLNDDQKTPLHIAARYGNPAMVKFLLTENCDPNLLDDGNFSSLHHAVEGGSLACVKAILEAGADVNSGLKKKDITPLYLALSHQNSNIIKYLVSQGADFNNIGLNQNALEKALETRNFSLIKYCIDELKLDVHQINIKTLLVLINYRESSILKYLVSKGVELPERDAQDRVIVEDGSSFAKEYEVLLQHSAVRGGDLLWLARSLEKQSNVNVTADDNKTLLHAAVEAGRIDMVDYLLQQGAYVQARADNQQTPLHIAVKLGQVDIVKSLLQYGANVNVRMTDGNTPLHLAAIAKNNEIIKLLLQKGASFNATNKKDEAPFDIGKPPEKPQKENANLLEEVTNLFANYDFKLHPEVFNLLTKLHQLPASSTPAEYQNNLRTLLHDFKADFSSDRHYFFASSTNKQISTIFEKAKQKIDEASQAQQSSTLSKDTPTASS